MAFNDALCFCHETDDELFGLSFNFFIPVFGVKFQLIIDYLVLCGAVLHLFRNYMRPLSQTEESERRPDRVFEVRFHLFMKKGSTLIWPASPMSLYASEYPTTEGVSLKLASLTSISKWLSIWAATLVVHEPKSIAQSLWGASICYN